MARIGIDIDGVAYRFVDKLRECIHADLGIPRTAMPPATRWEFYEDWGFSYADYKDLIRRYVTESDLFWRGEMYPGCREAIWNIYNAGHQVIFITSRYVKDSPNMAQHATYHWLNNEAGLPYHELVLSDNKFEHGVDVLFDDAPYQYEQNTANGLTQVVFDQLWNQHLTEAPRVYGWNGVLNYVENHYPIRNKSVTENRLTD